MGGSGTLFSALDPFDAPVRKHEHARQQKYRGRDAGYLQNDGQGRRPFTDAADSEIDQRCTCEQTQQKKARTRPSLGKRRK